jgi:hypothetical protein
MPLAGMLGMSGLFAAVEIIVDQCSAQLFVG